MTPAQAAERIGTSPQHVRALIRAGRIKAKLLSLGKSVNGFALSQYDITEREVNRFCSLPVDGRGKRGQPRPERRKG